MLLQPKPVKSLVLALLFALMGLGGLGYSLPRTAPMQEARRVVAHALSQALGVPVSVDRIEITATGNLVLRKIATSHAANGAAMQAQAGDALVDLSLWHYLRTRDALASISQVRIHSLTVHLSGKEVDLRSLFPQKQTNSKHILPFPLVISDVTVNWNSYTWHEQLLTLTPPAKSELLARVNLTRSTFSGLPLPDALAASGAGVLYTKGLQDLALRLTSPAGSAQVTGSIEWQANGQWNLQVESKRVRLENWVGTNSPQPFNFTARVLGALVAPQFSVTTGPVVWQGWRADRIQADFGLSEQALKVRSLIATRKKAAVSARGTLNLAGEPKADLTIQATGITAAELPTLPKAWPLTGTASFSGRLAGALQSLGLTGTARVKQGALWQTGFSDLHANVRWAGGKITLSDGKFSLPGSKTPVYQFSGSYNLGAKTLNAKVSSPGIPAAAALAWPHLTWPIEATVKGEVGINGPINRLVYTISVQAAQGKAWGQPFRELSVNLTYETGKTSIKSGAVRTANGKLTVTGDVGPDKLAVSFQASAMNARDLLQAAHEQIAKYAPGQVGLLQQVQKWQPVGAVSLQGTIQGSMRAPQLAAGFEATGMRLAGADAGNWTGRISGPLVLRDNNGTWALTSGRVNLGNGSLLLSGTLDAASAAVSKQAGVALLTLTGKAQQLPLAKALPLAQALLPKQERAAQSGWMWQDLANGTISGDWSLTSGRRATPQLTAKVALSGKVAEFPYTAQVEGTGWSGAVQFDRLQIQAAGGTAQLQGNLARGKVSINGTWANLPAAVVGAFAGVPQKLSGSLSGDVDVSSGSTGLQGSLSWQAPEIAVNNSRLTQLSGKLLAEGGNLTLVQWRGNAAGRTVQADGVVPLPAGLVTLFGGRRSDGYNLNVVIPAGPLAPLAGWLNLFSASKPYAAALSSIQATGEMKIHIGGTARAPKLDGQAAFSNGSYALPAPWGKLERVDGKVDFNGSTVKLVQASAAVLGGKLTAQGQISLRPGSSPSLVGQVSGNLQPKVAGISGEGDVRLNLGGTLAEPRFTGDIDVRRADVDLAALSLPTQPRQGGLPARFDVAINLRQLRVKAASLLDIPASGNLRLTGTLAEPGLNGQLQADRGRVIYLGTSFTVEEATADFAPYRGLAPNLNLWGTTWVGSTTIALRMKGSPGDLQVQLGSEPPLSQAEILALLEWPGQIDRLGSGKSVDMARGVVEVLQGGLEMGLMGGLEDAVRTSLGLDEFRLEPNLSERRVRLTAGKYLLPRIYMTYDRSLFAAPDESLGLEYRLDNGWKVSAGLRGSGEVRLGLEAKVRF